ncbi:MAG: hypothetical protein D4R57_00565 [Verrucomicrobiales bacterium]|nr:MAG: hypothetical protein D4R57_00565 [Verrucomicrobiales bacterium]
MKPKGILFKGEMIRALLNTKPDVWPAEPIDSTKPWKWQTRRLTNRRPFPEGKILYAKETHIPKASGVIYKADYDSQEAAGLGGMYGGWKSPIFMRRSYSRLWFEVVFWHMERVNQISEADAKAEGVCWYPALKPVAMYQDLWDSINGAGDFDKGKWVFAYDLKRISPP